MKNNNEHQPPRSWSSFWILLVVAVLLEGIACVQYFVSHEAVEREAVQRARNELRKVELEIENRTIEMETTAKLLAKLAEQCLDHPDSIYGVTRLAAGTLRRNTSLAVAFIPDYFPEKGRYYEVCSTLSDDGIYTRQIGSDEHDYTLMEWFRNGLAIDSCWWCEPYLDDSGSQTWVVSCSCPVHDRNGMVVAVVCVDLSLDYLEQLSEYLQVFPNSYYSISSGNGHLIVPAPDTIPGRKYYTFSEDIDATGWHMEIIIPDDVLYADLRRLGLIITLMMVLGLIVLAAMLFYAARTTRKLILSTEKNERMESELYIANAIQMAMLPKIFPPFADRPDLNIHGIVNPAKEVGGDLYDFYVRHDKLFFCIGDVSGKGVPASLVMAMTRSLFRTISSHEDEAQTIVKAMNNSLTEQNTMNMFLTFFVGVMDCKTGMLDYCNAGHNAPVLMTGGECSMLPVIPNIPLGVVADYPFEAQKVQIKPNDLLFLYTDGLTEAENGAHHLFGDERMIKSLQTISESCPRKVIEHVQNDVNLFVAGAEQSDDLTMLAIRYQYPALYMRNDIQQIPTLAEWLEGIGLPVELLMPINLAIEEAVTNVMLYAYPGHHGSVLVEFAKMIDPQTADSRAVFTITDSGIPFDPTQKPEVDISLSAEEREIGGLGIHLVRQIMSEVQYERKEEKNILTLVKNL